MAFEFIFIWTFESLFSIFIFSEKKIFREIAPKFSKKCWYAVQKSKKRKAVQAYFIQRYMYGGIFTVNGVTSVCSSKSTRSLIICTIYIIISSFLEIDFAINISDKKSRRFDLSEVIFKCIEVL